jgi:hypothetical protein
MAGYPHIDATERTEPFATTVRAIRVGGYDRAGDLILQVYSIVEPRYAVYRTEKRVMVHYSDDPAEQTRQEQQIGLLYSVRGQISSLIDGWRAGEDDRDSKGARFGNGRRAARYDRRIADSLLMALQGNSVAAIELLNEAKNDIVNERQSMARIDYLWTAMAVTGFFVLLMAAVSSATLFSMLHRLGPPYSPIWTAVCGGTMGAFFSIATGLNRRTVLIDLQNRNNRADAALRVMIGAISGGILLCLLSSGLAANSLIDIDQLNKTDVESTLLVFVLGFLAGFAERLLPDLLEKAQLGLEVPSGDGGTAGKPEGSGGGGGRPTPPVAPIPVPVPTVAPPDIEPTSLPVEDPDAPLAGDDDPTAGAPEEALVAPASSVVDDPDRPMSPLGDDATETAPRASPQAG